MTPRPLAATKFLAPALPSRYVPRQRLQVELDAGAHLPLTIVVGVPGAGKSVMLGSWLYDHPELRSIWLSCDARDSDSESFWVALGAALTHAWPDRWVDVIDLLSESKPDLDDVAIAIVNELADLGEPVVLVIDDFQFAAAAAPTLTTLIERLPQGCRVVVGSRTEPQLALHRLRVHGQLLELRDGELRLTPAEVAEVMHEFEVEVNETEIELLAARTEGWMAGVQMAAVSLRGRSDRERFLVDLAKTRRAITDFLSAEVLDRQTPEIREFLLDTSILDVLDSESCAAVAERRDAAVLLGRLEVLNLFLIELGEGTYRYHHLFADLLRLRLHAEDPDRELALHRRAARYYVERGDPETAIGHLLEAGDDAEAFDVLRRNVVGAFYRRDGRMPHRLAASIESHGALIEPAHLPDLALALAASGPAREARPWIGRATRHVGELSDIGHARLAVAQGLVAMQDGDALAIQRAFDEYPTPEHLPDEELVESVRSMLVRSRLWLGDAVGARAICEQSLASVDGPSVPQVTMTSALAWVACVEGCLTEADHWADQALAGAESIGLAEHPVMDAAIRAQGRVAYERGDLVAAERSLEHSISISEDLRPAFALVSQLSLSRVWLALGQVGDALDGVARAREFLLPDSTSPLLGLCDALEGRIAIEIGDLDRAERCAQRLAPGTRAFVLQSRIDLARGEWARARETLARCVPETVREHLGVAMVAAMIAHERRSDDADAVLAAMLEVAKSEGFVVAVTDDMVELRPRVALLLRSGRIGKYEQAVLDRLERDLPVVRVNSGTARLLSDREQMVVRYLVSRLTYKEIAAEIFVSTNTLKTHVKRIYGKLGVSSRTEAVTEARRLGVL